MNPDKNNERRSTRGQAAFPLTYRPVGPRSLMHELGFLDEPERNATASDLSKEGLSLFVDFDLPAGIILALKFSLIGDGPSSGMVSRKMELQAEVRRSSPGLIKGSFIVGASFVQLSEVDRAFIAGAIGA